MINAIAGGITLLTAFGLYRKHTPPVSSWACKTLALAAGAGVLSAVAPVAGLLQWLALAAQLVLLGCCVAAGRSLRVQREHEENEKSLAVLRQEMRKGELQ